MKTSFFLFRQYKAIINFILILALFFAYIPTPAGAWQRSGDFRGALIPSDSYFSYQWYLKKIRAPGAWDIIRDSSGVTIAVVDSGVQIDHPDLRDNIWRNVNEVPGNGIDDDKNGYVDDVNGWDFVNNISDPSPKFVEGYTEDGVSHGTIVAGIAASSGNNASGVSGVTWNSRIMPLKVLDDTGAGDVRNVIKAIDYAIANRADIINFSFVGFSYHHGLKQAIERAYDNGIIMVAAAGNESGEGSGCFLDETPMYPVCYDSGRNMIIGVSATDTLDQKAPFSGYGFSCIDISAPGISVYAPTVYAPAQYYDNQPFDKYYNGFWSGTSLAVPMVSGAIALIEAANPSLSRDEVVDILLRNADNINRLNPGYLGQLGLGRLNVEKAVAESRKMLKETEGVLVFAPLTDKEPDVVMSDYAGKYASSSVISAYALDFRGGVNVAAGDVDGDGIDELITGAGQGGGPHVRIFNRSGELQGQFFAYALDFRGGVNVAAGDVDGGASFNKDEIVVTPASGMSVQVRIFDDHAVMRYSFYAYNKNFQGGARVAMADMDKDGLDELITAAGPGGAPHIRSFDHYGRLITSFYSYEEGFGGGVSVAALRYKDL